MKKLYILLFLLIPLNSVFSKNLFNDFEYIKSTHIVLIDEIDEALSFAQEGKFLDAINIIMPLALNDNSEAQYWLSKFYDSVNNKEESLEWLDKSAQNNYSQAQYDLAWSMCGNWFSADIDKLVEIIYWFERAGYNGSTKAYANLSILYDDASSDEKGRRKIFSEMEKAAKNGNAMAQFNMGWIYARGLLTEEGLMQDLQIAEDWFRKSASLGFVDAINILQDKF